MSCRLCGNAEFVINMFDEKVHKVKLTRWRYYALLATGIQIVESDIISKMVCHTCCELVEKIYKYRVNAVANDKLLKEQLGQVYVPPILNLEQLQRAGGQILPETSDISVTVAIPDIPVSNRLIVPKPVYKHDTVTELIEKHPNIILPNEVLRCDVNPDVTLDEREVTDWYDEYVQRFQQRLLLGNIKIKRVNTGLDNNCINIQNEDVRNGSQSEDIHSEVIENDVMENDDSNNAEDDNSNAVPDQMKDVENNNTQNGEDDRSSLLQKIIINEKVVDETLDPITCLNKLLAPKTVGKSSTYKPCPKSKKLQILSEVVFEQKQQANLVLQLLEDTSTITTLVDLLTPLDSLNTQINQISTTTLDTAIPKKKRKPRRKTIMDEFIADEIIPAKKNRIYYDINSMITPDKLDVPKYTPSSATQHKKLLASSLELASNAESSAFDDVFPCQICLKLYDTSKELRIHQRRHFGCKYCKRRMSSLKRLEIHESQRCHVRIKQNPPKLELIKVDEIQSIVTKYHSAFRNSRDNDVVCKSSVSKGIEIHRITSVMAPKQPNNVRLTPSSTASAVSNSSVAALNPLLNGQLMNPYLKPLQGYPRLTDQRVSCATPAVRPILPRSNSRPAPPPYPSNIPPNTMPNTSSGQNVPLQTTAGKTPLHSKDFLFTDAELLDMLNLPLSSEHLPNTTFHYSPISPSPVQIMTTAQQSAINTHVPKASPSTTEVKPNMAGEPAQWTSVPNKTVHHIPTSSSIQAPQNATHFQTSYFTDTLNTPPGYPQTDAGLLQNQYVVDNTWSPDLWMQQEATTPSASALQLLAKYNASQTLKQVPTVASVTMEPAPYANYQQALVNQMKNYYNAQNGSTGYQYSYGNLTGSAQVRFNPYSNLPPPPPAHSSNVRGTNQFNNVNQYSHLAPTYNQNVNVGNTQLGMNSANLHNISSSNVNHFIVPPPTILGAVSHATNNTYTNVISGQTLNRQNNNHITNGVAYTNATPNNSANQNPTLPPPKMIYAPKTQQFTRGPNPTPAHSSNVQNVNQNVINNKVCPTPGTSYRNQSGPNGNSKSTAVAGTPTEEATRRKGLLRLKQTWQLC